MICLMLVYTDPFLGCLFELNDMGYHLNRISPITFDKDAFQTPDNRTQGRTPMSMLRKKGKQSNSQVDQQGPPMNKTYPLKQVLYYIKVLYKEGIIFVLAFLSLTPQNLHHIGQLDI